MKVKATERGYYGGRIIEEDQVFEIQSEEELGVWMKKVEPAKADEPAKAAAHAKPAAK